MRYLVLDEADEMLDMGFIDDIEAILNETPKERQTALFSATFPARINDLVRRHLRDPERITIKAEVRKTPRVRQVAYVVPRPHKLRGARPHPRPRVARPPRSSSAARAPKSTS